MRFSKKIVIFVLTCFIFLPIFLVLVYPKTSSPKPTFKLEQKELEAYYRAYQNPYVLYLRQALNAYLANDSSKTCILAGTVKRIEGEIEGEKMISGLEAFDKDYYKSKFIVTTIDDNQTEKNGRDIQIIFQDKPDRIFYAWVGERIKGDNQMCLLAFNSKANFDQKVLKEMLDYYEPYISDKEHAL